MERPLGYDFIIRTESTKEETDMMLHVQYADLHYDYVSPQTLDRLLASRELRQFFRPSEKRWVSVQGDTVRGKGGDYSGPDRRQLI